MRHEYLEDSHTVIAANAAIQWTITSRSDDLLSNSQDTRVFQEKFDFQLLCLFSLDPGLRRGDGSGDRGDGSGDRGDGSGDRGDGSGENTMSFFSELRRRKVFQVAAVYAVVAWLTIQIIDVISEPLSLPGWLDTVVIVLLAVGFPIAVIVAWAFDLTPQGIEATGPEHEAAPPPAGGQRLTHISQALVLLAVGFLVFDQYVLEREPVGTPEVAGQSSQTTGTSPPLVRRYSINLGNTRPKGGALIDADIDLSSDGRRLVYAVQREETPQLYLRELDLAEAQALPGTEGAFNPFFSPDGEWIGFFRDEGIHTVSVRGGPTKEVSGPALGGPGSVWSPDDTILFTADATEDNLINTGIAGDRYPLVRSMAAGGTPEPLDLDTGMRTYIYAWPHALPDGESLLFTASEFSDARGGSVFLFSSATGETRILIRGAYNARYTPTGHIVFMRSATLWAVPFDLESMQTTGREVPVIEGIQTGGDRGQAVYAFSDDGLLIYLPGFDTQFDEESARIGRTLTWVSPDGSEEIITGFEPRFSANPRLSPDGQFLAITVRTEATGPNENWDIWIYDLERRTTSRLTFDPSNDQRPLWTPDGQHIVYTRLGDDGGLFRQAANGTGSAERLTELTELTLGPRAESFSPDGAYLVFRAQSEANGGWNLYLLSLLDEPTTQPLLQEDFSEFRSDLSPDGRWIAYTSNETGENEVYVRPFPNVEDGKWQISAGGGSEPRWGSEGRELFYLGNLDDSALVRVDIDTESGFKAGSPEELFLTDDFQTAGASAPNYDLLPNGQQFLMLKNFQRANLEGPTELIVVDNWFEELKRLAPADAP